MTLSPSNAIAIAPDAWDDHAAKRRMAERIGSVENLVIKIMSGIERNIKRGACPDTVAPVVAAWAGPLMKYVSVVELRPRRGIGGGVVLVLRASNAVVVSELRPRLHRLLADLKTTGIAEVLWR